MSDLKLDIIFSATSLRTNEVVEGYYLRLSGYDFIITPDGVEHLIDSTSLKLIHHSVESISKSINDTIDNTSIINSALVLFDANIESGHATVGTVRSSIAKAVQMLSDWGLDDPNAKQIILSTGIKLCCGVEDDCEDCTRFDCPRNPKHGAKLIVPFIKGKKAS